MGYPLSTAVAAELHRHILDTRAFQPCGCFGSYTTRNPQAAHINHHAPVLGLDGERNTSIVVIGSHSSIRPIENVNIHVVTHRPYRIPQTPPLTP